MPRYPALVSSQSIAYEPSFLFFRASKVGNDGRLEDLLHTTTGSFQFWLITFVWNVFCSMPFLLGLNSNGCGIGGDATFLQAGGALYLTGLCIETLADVQKWWFKKSYPGNFCNTGLWSISQHPNYFGNLLLWLGILVMNVPWLIESVTATPLIPTSVTEGSTFRMIYSAINGLWRFRRFIIALVSPWFLWTLFNSQAQGTMGNSVTLANSKYKSDPDYQKYLTEVPLIIPKFW